MLPVTTPGNVGHEAPRLPAHDPARPQPGLGLRVAGRWGRSQPRLTLANCADTSERGLLNETVAIHDGPEAASFAAAPSWPRRAELWLRKQHLGGPLSTSTRTRTWFSEHRDLKPIAASKCEDPDC